MNAAETVADVFLDAARRAGDAPCLVHGSTILTYQQVRQQVETLAAYLIFHCKIRSGATVVVVCDSDPRWLVVSLALQMVGAIEVPLGAQTPLRDFRNVVTSTKCRLLITEDEYSPLRGDFP